MRTILFLTTLVLILGTAARNSDAQTTRAKNPSLLPPRTRSVAKAPQDSANIRLTYWETPWSKVFRDVASISGSELVMDRIPNGNYNRADRNLYTRSEAVQILNQSLERLNFRMFEQGKYLIVMPHQVARSRYGRPVIRPEDAAPEPTAQSVQQSTPYTVRKPVRQTHTIRPGVARPDRAGYGTTQSVNSYQPETGDVATAEYYSRNSQTGMVRLSSNEGSAAVGKPDLKEAVVTPKNLPAVEIARAIYKAFNQHAKLVDVGPGGFPGVTISWPQKFDLGIDTNTNRLFVSGEGSQVQGAVKMIQLLDRTPKLDQKTELIPADQKTSQIAVNLKPTLNKLITQPVQAPLPQPRPNVGPEGNPEDINAAMLGGLKGDVSIQNVPGIGLVVTGNEEDVKKVMAVIRQIEQLSVGTNPDIHLALLTNVDSTALAALLTTVYERLAAVRNPQARTTGTNAATNATVAIVPVVKPNAVLIIAPTVALESLLGLIEKLDRPVDPRTEFSVFHLRSAISSQVVRMLQQFYQERGGLGTKVIAYADSRTNSVVVQAQPRDMAEVAALVEKIDRDTTAAVNQMKIYPLKNAVAEELVEVLNTAIQSVLNAPTTVGQGPGGGGGQGSQALREAKSAVLQFLTIDRKEGRVVSSGILADIRITADMRTNSLVVTAPGKSMALMGALIEQLDKPTANVAEIKVFSLENADATTVVGLLQNLFVQTTGGQQAQTGIQVVGAEGASSSLIPLRFSIDVRTNSIIAVGGAEALQVVEAILFRLDENEIRQRENLVYRLKNSPAADVATAINQFLTSRRDITQADPSLISPFEQIEQEVIVVPELVSNSLIISATPRYFNEIQELVLQLDAAPAQVIIQALLVEVVLDNADEFGVELGFQDSLLFDRSVTQILETIQTTTTAVNGVQTTTTDIISQTSDPGFNFNNQPLGNNTAARNSDKVGTQGLSNFAVGRVNSELGFGGLVLSAGSENISMLLRALSQNRDVNILSRPQIRTIDNQLAEIQVGQQVPIVNGVTVSAQGLANPQIIQDQAGIILSVTPRINSEGIIVMEVVAEKSQFSGAGVPIFTQTDGSVITSPIKDITTARATVSVPNNQTIVLGGMITKSTESIQRKVPWLGDIPILKYAFSYESTTSRRTELLIFLTPRIIRHNGDSEMIKQVEMERMHFIESEAEEIHGPLFGIPSDEPLDIPQPITTEAFQNSMPLPAPGVTFPELPPAPQGEIINEGGVPTTTMGVPSAPGSFPEMSTREMSSGPKLQPKTGRVLIRQ